MSDAEEKDELRIAAHRVFTVWDKSMNGDIEFAEFNAGLKRLGTVINMEQKKMVWNIISKDNFIYEQDLFEFLEGDYDDPVLEGFKRMLIGSSERFKETIQVDEHNPERGTSRRPVRSKSTDEIFPDFGPNKRGQRRSLYGIDAGPTTPTPRKKGSSNPIFTEWKDDGLEHQIGEINTGTIAMEPLYESRGFTEEIASPVQLMSDEAGFDSEEEDMKEQFKRLSLENMESAKKQLEEQETTSSEIDHIRQQSKFLEEKLGKASDKNKWLEKQRQLVEKELQEAMHTRWDLEMKLYNSEQEKLRLEREVQLLIAENAQLVALNKEVLDKKLEWVKEVRKPSRPKWQPMEDLNILVEENRNKVERIERYLKKNSEFLSIDLSKMADMEKIESSNNIIQLDLGARKRTLRNRSSIPKVLIYFLEKSNTL